MTAPAGRAPAIRRGGRNAARPRTSLTSEQRSAAMDVADRLAAGADEVVVGGLAGVGKSVVASEIHASVGVSRAAVAYAAPTGKAAHELSKKLRGPQATTIHRLIYWPVEQHCTKCPRRGWAGGPSSGPRCHGYACDGCAVRYERREELDEAVQLIVVDEASMVSEELHGDLTAYGIPVLWFGDIGQLPPVKSEFHLMAEPDVLLTTIHRQAADSPILKLAMQARRTGRIRPGRYGPGVVVGGDTEFDVELVHGRWPSETIILCGRNSTRVETNRMVRGLLGYPDEPVPSDRVICLRNNHALGVFNGTTGTVLSIRPRTATTYDAVIAVDGAEGLPPYRGVIAAEQFHAERTCTEVPRHTDLFDYAYCMTVHKAQGSEADRVVLYDEWFGKDRARWLYTGITRARQHLQVITTGGPR